MLKHLRYPLAEEGEIRYNLSSRASILIFRKVSVRFTGRPLDTKNFPYKPPKVYKSLKRPNHRLLPFPSTVIISRNTGSKKVDISEPN